jgi:predicted ArsR family transcriptional regulator
MGTGERTTERPDDLAAVSALGEPTRRAIYDYVVRTGRWVSREEAADAIGLERGTAAHHLDRLAGEGLVEVDYQRLSGRQGPGAGRPAKLYRRSRRDLEVNLPSRDYRLAGKLLANAAERSRSEGTNIATALDDVARAEGRQLAEAVRPHLRGAAARKPARLRRAVLEVLADRGFEPTTDADGTVVLRNCPFHQLAQEHTDLICGMNFCLLDAAIEDLGETGLKARLEPEEGLCCVRLHRIG